MTDTLTNPYQVLARKYRPSNFDDLVGQSSMVRTLKNAFDAKRIAQAFILTGIRGTGKTTTARIIAKGMNCIGPDGAGEPTTHPCGVCEPCKAIAASAHVDVLEMDAASRTGVGDIREIIDSVHYRAASARYKIFIIDEVHMLSNNAFNALLKTLEEPPEHVKFIFATTEIRKVPVTVLSRCQRFDLRRVEAEEMLGLLERIMKAENAQISERALSLITRASEGSVRDALSLLDQAIAHQASDGADIRAMLGIADRGRIFELFELILKGDASGALEEFSAQYANGTDPEAVLRDLAEVTHWVSVIKVSAEVADDPTVTPEERTRGLKLADQISMRVLSRFWQMLLKALEEVANAPNAVMAVEMAIIRLTHAAMLPPPDELIRKLQDTTPEPMKPTPAISSGGGEVQGSSVGNSGQSPIGSAQFSKTQAPSPVATALTARAMPMDDNLLAQFANFESVLALIRANRDPKLLYDVEHGMQIVQYQPGRIEFQNTDSAPSDLAQRLTKALKTWTGQTWGISVVSTGGTKTVAEMRADEKKAEEEKYKNHPMIKAVFTHFKKAKILSFTSHTEHVLPKEEEQKSDEDNWDPFEDSFLN